MISIDMTKAKDIAHDKRRAARSAEFAPLDIKATIPSEAAAAEAARQAIREKYATLQAQMDAAQTADELKALLPEA
jgi:predicted  nucleic acid-binding Zn-ribbon protein